MAWVEGVQALALALALAQALALALALAAVQDWVALGAWVAPPPPHLPPALLCAARPAPSCCTMRWCSGGLRR